MAILNKSTDGSLTLLDIRNNMGANDAIIVDAIDTTMQTSLLMAEFPMVQCNMQNSMHKGLVVTGYPDVYWSAINQGVAPSKGTTATITEGCARTETFSRVHDYALDGLTAANKAATRQAQDRLHFKAHPLEHARTLIYGEKGDKKKYCGLAARYSTPSTDTDETGFNMVDFSPGTYNPANGGNLVPSAANASYAAYTSIYLITMGQDALHGIYPQDSKAGFNYKDLGLLPYTNASNETMMCWQGQYTQEMGIFLANWRYVVRGVNLDTTALVQGTSTKNMIHGMMRMLGRVPQGGAGRQMWVMNRMAIMALSIAAEERTSNAVGYADFGGRRMLSFQGIPVVQEDAILSTETGITGNFAHL